MARMNWSKATKTYQVRNSGFEQACEFGDVIDRSRKAAVMENLRLASGSRPPPPPNSKSKQVAAKANSIKPAKKKEDILRQEANGKIQNGNGQSKRSEKASERKRQKLAMRREALLRKAEKARKQQELAEQRRADPEYIARTAARRSKEIEKMNKVVVVIKRAKQFKLPGAKVEEHE